ncbi:MAG: peptide chain release factor N(5)-glutamine methyltransferase [Bacteroidota bacterium]
MPDRMQYQALYQRLATFLPETEADMHTRILLEAGQGKSPDWFERCLNRLKATEPIQYILGETDFYGRHFVVNPSVLIPRQETEELMVWARDEVPKKTPHRPIQALDIGTGSGCIPVSLWLEWQEKGIPSTWTGLDVSEAALQMARQNAVSLQAEVLFQVTDITTAVADDFSGLDLIISNPPYVPPEELADMQLHVRNHEPHLALFTPHNDPLYFFRIIGQLGKSWLKPGGLLFFEGHLDHMQAVADMLTAAGWQEVMLRKDLNGRDRMIRAMNG